MSDAATISMTGAFYQSHKNHDRVVLGKPGEQHAVLPVEVPTTDLIDYLAREPIASGIAASILELADGSQSRCPSTTSEGADLTIRH